MANEEKKEHLEQKETQEVPQTEETQYTYEKNDAVDFSGAGEVVRSPVEKKTEEPPVPETKKESYQFPHQLLLRKLNIPEKDVDKNTLSYIGDFNDFLKHVKMAKASAEKKGNEYKLPETKKNKLLRLSKSVCHSLQTHIDVLQEEEDKIRSEKEEKINQENRRRQFLIEKREESMRAIKEEQEKKKKEEDDTIGFWF